MRLMLAVFFHALLMSSTANASQNSVATRFNEFSLSGKGEHTAILPPEVTSIFTKYFVCSAIAEKRVLTGSEAESCSELYLATKLHFVPNVDVETFRALSPTEKATINKKAYLAFLAWKSANPELVKALKQRANNVIAWTDS